MCRTEMKNKWLEEVGLCHNSKIINTVCTQQTNVGQTHVKLAIEKAIFANVKKTVGCTVKVLLVMRINYAAFRTIWPYLKVLTNS